MNGVDPQLLKAVREGTYIVDPHAVAAASVGRPERRAEAERLAQMFEAVERDGLAGDGGEHGSGPQADVA